MRPRRPSGMLTFALSPRGLPASTWSQAAEAVESTSHDTAESTSNGIANGKRSRSKKVGIDIGMTYGELPPE